MSPTGTASTAEPPKKQVAPLKSILKKKPDPTALLDADCQRQQEEEEEEEEEEDTAHISALLDIDSRYRSLGYC
jgi:CO dehydrogenase/acetyl-CoA synthase beta subunit